MSKSGLFAGKSTQDAPTNGALTTKQRGYHWFEWTKAIPTSGEFSETLGGTASQNGYNGRTSFPHPFEGQTFPEFTVSVTYQVSREPTFADNRRDTFGTIPMKIYQWYYSSNNIIQLYGILSGGKQMALGIEKGAFTTWLWDHWYCCTISFSQTLDTLVMCWSNLTLGEEYWEYHVDPDNTPVDFTGATSGTAASMFAYGGGQANVDAPDYMSNPFVGTLSNFVIHNKYIDLGVEGNRRAFCGIDGVINIGERGQNIFNEIPLLYMPQGGPWDSRGTANTGVYPDDFWYRQPLSLDQNLPPVAS